jgi:hypothetical protein
MESTLADHIITFILRMIYTNRKYFRSVLIVAIIIAAFIVLTPSENYTTCYNNSYFLKTKFSGLVVRKFVDKSQHSTPTVEVKDVTNNAIKSVSFFGDYSGLYHKIEVGDTVVKNPESLEVHFRKGNGRLILIERQTLTAIRHSFTRRKKDSDFSTGCFNNGLDGKSIFISQSE